MGDGGSEVEVGLDYVSCGLQGPRWSREPLSRIFACDSLRDQGLAMI